jgi:hypothetical protein
MRTFYALALAILIASPVLAQAKGASTQAEQNALVITFKDGHQQTIPLSDLAKMEFKTGATQTSLRGTRALFTGEWKVGTGAAGETFLITLAADGTATKTHGSPGGHWEVINGEARITWDDGWRDVIRKVGSKYEKAAYAPGKPLSESPSNVASATRTEPM